MEKETSLETQDRYVCVYCLLIALFLIGCKDKSDSDKKNVSELTIRRNFYEPNALSSQEDSMSPCSLVFARAINHWIQNRHEQAISTFIHIEWSNRIDFPNASPLSLTEKEFNKLSKSEAKKVMDEIMAEIMIIESLCNAIFKEARLSSNKAKYYKAVNEFAEALIADKDSLLILQAIGRKWRGKVQTLRRP